MSLNLHSNVFNKKAVLSQRWPRDAPYIWIWGSPWICRSRSCKVSDFGTKWKAHMRLPISPS